MAGPPIISGMGKTAIRSFRIAVPERDLTDLRDGLDIHVIH